MAGMVNSRSRSRWLPAPGDRRVGGHQPVQSRLAAQHRDLGGQAVPTRASVTARSRTTLAGSWTANGIRHCDSAADNAGPNPAAAIVSGAP